MGGVVVHGETETGCAMDWLDDSRYWDRPSLGRTMTLFCAIFSVFLSLFEILLHIVVLSPPYGDGLKFAELYRWERRGKHREHCRMRREGAEGQTKYRSDGLQTPR